MCIRDRLEKLRSTLGVQGVELCRGVPQLWEFVVASLFSLWVSVTAGHLYTTRPVKPTQHLNRLTGIKEKLPSKPKDRRWMDMLNFIPHFFSDKCSVKTRGMESLPSLDTLIVLRNQFADWVATSAECDYEFTPEQIRPVSYTHLPSPRDRTRSRMPSSA